MKSYAAAVLKLGKIALLGIFLLSVSTLHQSARAQGTINARFGLSNAYQNPEAARDSGAGWELVTLRWSQLQPNGPTDWNPDPELTQWLAEARAAGREVVAVVIDTPKWATSGSSGSGVPRGLYLPVADAGNTWAGFMNRAANYYGSRGINRWVIWRNPDIAPKTQDSTWDGSLEEYYQLVKVAYLAARGGNPSALIHLGGVGDYDPNWFSRFLEIALDDPTAPANNYYFDVATLHVYDSPERVYTLMRNHFFVMDQKGVPLKEVWINETNARPAVDTVYPADVTFRDHPRTTVDQQASFIVQAYALAFAANRGARIGTYRLVDDLPADGQQAFGLMRADGSARPAYDAYQLIAEQFNGFIFARRVDEETAPLIDYVRLTFSTKVTHVIWALTKQNATLVIPARTDQATLLDIHGNQWQVQPQGGVYRVAAEGADCNDPAVGCLIGGSPWLLVEDGIPDAVDEQPPSVTVEAGGEPPTPDPNAALTATALAQPTETPTDVPTETPLPTETAVPTEAPVATAESSETPVEIAAVPSEVAEVAPAPTESSAPEEPALPTTADFQPKGLAAVLPYLLIAVGVLALGGGGWYFFAGHQKMAESAAATAPTQEYERPDLEEEEAVTPDEEPVEPPPAKRRSRKKPPPPEE